MIPILTVTEYTNGCVTVCSQEKSQSGQQVPLWLIVHQLQNHQSMVDNGRTRVDGTATGQQRNHDPCHLLTGMTVANICKVSEVA